ncbi:MAG: hypothetical protein VX044_08025 [Planctomycetota bacterium]|nr:hypothetical protein [Planctomycetota bacterium]MEC8651298.1 hypothetical protein [Planctomycetota bacterium]
MSPIGRVFIVLNLFLAGGFAVMGGQLLNNQANWKQKHADEAASHEADNQKFLQQIENLKTERGNAENAKTSFETQLAAAQTSIGNLQDENKRLAELTSSQAADLKKAVSLQEAANTQAKAAFEQAQAAYQASIDAQKVRDDAVRSKDSAEAENRNLKNDIASLNETINGKDQQIASLERDNSEKDLLVQAAKVRGFSEAMAAPSLAGTVTNASGRLCTISISANPGNVDIQDQINRRPFSFAIFDDNGYKAEAVATKYEASANAVLCTIRVRNGGAAIRTGDKASTQP